MNMDHILSNSDLDSIAHNNEQYRYTIEDISHGINMAIDQFESNDVVISLVNSGNLGANVETNLREIVKNLERLKNVVEKLYFETDQFVDDQRVFVNRNISI